LAVEKLAPPSWLKAPARQLLAEGQVAALWLGARNESPSIVTCDPGIPAIDHKNADAEQDAAVQSHVYLTVVAFDEA
jgi:hypothetical protein